jgi:hypothetical protein
MYLPYYALKDGISFVGPDSKNYKIKIAIVRQNLISIDINNCDHSVREFEKKLQDSSKVFVV